METNNASRDLLPVHLQPKHDELTSSWLVRLAIAYVMEPDKFYSLLIPEKPNFPTHIDETTDELILMSLAMSSRLTLNKIKATTLFSYGINLPTCHYLGHPTPWSMSRQWIMPSSDKNYPSQLFGMQFCPYCLSEDEIPYFRRRWRLAFITLCGTHRALLLDRCTRCGLPIDYRSNASKAKGKRPTLAMTRCHSCKFDIRYAVPPAPPRSAFPDAIKFQESLFEALDKKVMTSYFNEMHRITRLVAFGGFGKFIRTQLCRRYGIRLFNVVRPEKHKCIEMFSVKERFDLLRVVGPVIAEWPDGLFSSH